MSNTYTDSSGRMRNETTAPDTAIDAQGNRINIDENAHKSDSIVGSVVEAAKAAGQRVKEAFTGPSEPTAMDSDYASRAGIKENARDTSQSMKESARGAKENLMDTVDDTKAKARDIRTSAKESLNMDTTGDRIRDFGANVNDRMGTASEKAKDRLQNVNERAENIGYDARDRAQDANARLNDNSTGSTFENVKEKVKDAVDSGTEKIKQAFSRTGENTDINTYPASGSSGLSQYHTEDAKSKMASAGAKAADKTEDLAGSAKDKLSSGMGYSNDWTTNAKANLYDKADQVQDWAADQKHKANADTNVHEKNKQAIRNTGFNPVDPQI